jgi:septal ring factor EnvC (AmiA/AmiB activator)
VFIRAPQGAEVHAVAAGRVVFADWLRGFGNLLVLDHGEGLLTVYGNNETLLANAGERVGAGEVIASVGNTGGNADPGLYFEMRFQGRPIDPLRWAAAR